MTRSTSIASPRRASARRCSIPASWPAPPRDAFVKLNPRKLVRNPVIFVTEVVAALVTVALRARAVHAAAIAVVLRARSPPGSGSPCCSPTSPRRWPKAAARRRPTTLRAHAHRDAWPSACADARRRAICRRRSSAHELQVGDVVLVEAGDLIPGRRRDRSRASPRSTKSAITGESAPVIREVGGDRSAVTGGTTWSPTGSRCGSPRRPAPPSSTA